MYYLGSPGNDCTKDENTAEEVGRLRRPTSCAVVLNTIISWTLKLTYNNTYLVYLREHILFEVQLCVKISIFDEHPDFLLVINLCLMTSLL